MISSKMTTLRDVAYDKASWQAAGRAQGRTPSEASHVLPPPVAGIRLEGTETYAQSAFRVPSRWPVRLIRLLGI